MSDEQILSDPRRPDPLFEGDRGSLTFEGRRALVMLLKNTHISVAQHGTAWEALLLERERIEEILSEVFLVLHVNEQAGVAYKTQAEPEGNLKFNTLLNQRPLSRTEVRVLLHLRELIREGAVAGQARVMVTGQELLDRLAEAYPEHKGDHVAARERDKGALRNLAADDFLVPPRGSTAAEPEGVTYTVSGLVEALVTPSTAKAFAEALRNDTAQDDAADDPDPEAEEGLDDRQGDLLDELDEEELA